MVLACCALHLTSTAAVHHIRGADDILAQHHAAGDGAASGAPGEAAPVAAGLRPAGGPGSRSLQTADTGIMTYHNGAVMIGTIHVYVIW